MPLAEQKSHLAHDLTADGAAWRPTRRQVAHPMLTDHLSLSQAHTHRPEDLPSAQERRGKKLLGQFRARLGEKRRDVRKSFFDVVGHLSL